jgi:antibiotic biosynthesis monooxygenase (ABM) superfamily enzyme
MPNSTSPGFGPPTKHQLAVMIWLAVFPTLTAINLTLGGWLRPMSPVLRTFVLATIAVPIVMYGVMPQLHKARARWATGTQLRAETRRRHTAQP